MTGYQSIQEQGPDLQRMVDELVKDHTHREPYIVRQSGGVGFIAHHQSRVPALIDQLLEPAPGGKGELSGAESQARPAVRVEAHDTIALIAEAAGEWIDRLGGTIPGDVITPQVGRRHAALAAVRGSGAKRALVILRALDAGLIGDDSCGRAVGCKVEVEIEAEIQADPELDSKDYLLGQLDDQLEPTPEPEPERRREWCCTSHHIEADVRSWWQQARIIAGWDSPTYRPFAACPNCSTRRGLRINLAAHTAVCVECRTVWDPSSIGLLAEHIRRENEGDQEADEDDLEAEPA